MRWVRGVAAALALALGVVGAPLALAAWGRYPAGPATLRADDGLLLVALTVIGWVAWGTFAVATATELASLITGRSLRLPGLGPLQYLAGGLLLLVIAVLPLARAAAPTTPAALAIVEPESAPQPAVAQPAVQQPTTQPPGGTEAPAPTTLPETPGYTVVAGDDLWSIAERLFGDGRDWRVLHQLNPGLADPLHDLQPGTRLAIPATAEAFRTSGTKPETVAVHKGDTLSELAEEHLGKASKWPKIAAANAIITDPDHIEIGWKLRIPGGHSASAANTSPAPDQGEQQAKQPAGPGVHHGAAASPAEPTESAAPAPPAPAAPEAPTSSATEDSSPATAPLTIGTLAAAALVGSLEFRRVLRQRERPLGRRLPPATEGADRLRTALKAVEQPDSLAALVAALAAIGRHCHESGLELPALASVRLTQDEIRLAWAAPTAGPPFGFTGDEQHWIAAIAPPFPSSEAPCPYPALVSLGTASNGEVLLIDAEQSRVLGVAGNQEQQRNALSALGVELACAPWSAEARLVVSGSIAALIGLAGDDRVQVASQDLALAKLRQVVTRRRQALATTPLRQLRVDPERADSVAAYIFCFADELPAELLAEVEQLLAGDPVGVAVILPTSAEAQAQWQVGGEVSHPEGHLAGHPGTLAAHVIDAEVRAQLAELFTDIEPVPAPWWAQDNVYQLPIRDEDEVDIIRLLEPAAHPRLLLIGPAELHHTSGPEPARSRQQLTELCAWMVEHPNSTATQMSSGLALAESTRRSNLSRLRNWLGSDEAGEPYLPDAYSGRISLHPGVTSDWQQLQVLLAPGIPRVADKTLVTALELVRGAPLADAAPGQWYWAEELRTDIASALRDVGVALAERALRNQDLDLARWAAGRALVVAPEDELLLGARLRTEYLAGNRADVERLVNQLTRQARILGVDLMPETIQLCQQAIEGRTRARA